jgi:serine/threonine-protein kinase
LLLAERYRIIALVGRGGMGEVYRASDIRLNQPVALKFLPEAVAKKPGLLGVFTARFALSSKSRIPMSPLS